LQDDFHTIKKRWAEGNSRSTCWCTEKSDIQRL